MFPARYFPNRMFAPRYWAKVGEDAAPVTEASRQGAWFTHAAHYLLIWMLA